MRRALSRARIARLRGGAIWLALLLGLGARAWAQPPASGPTPSEQQRSTPTKRPTTEEELERERLEAIEAPVDRTVYRLGPGDRLAVTLNLPTQHVLESVVTAEGTLIVPPASGVRVAGLSIQEAQDVLIDSLRVYFKGITPHLDLMNVRKFEVYALGLVAKPGSYVVDGATRAAAVIDMAGDVLPGGSRRSIRVQAADGTSRRVDLVKFLAIGDRDANPVLQDGDWVVVPHSGETAVIRGAVSRQGSYEVLEGETLEDLIIVSGGSLASADRARVELRRFTTPSGLQTESSLIDLDGPNASTPIQPGDQVFVPDIPDYHLQRTAAVQGEVLYPGTYVIDEGEETLSQLIARAGGFTADAALHQATLTRSVGADTADAEFDRLKAIPVADMSRNEYEYFKLRSREKRGRVAVDFEAIFERGDKSADILLRRGDTIMVPIATHSIEVSGQVASPGALAFEEGRDIRWYIKQAGGYGWRADTRKTRVIRSRTGQWVPAGEVKELEPGDTIWIPEKSDKGFWTGVKEGLVVVGQLLTVYLVIDAISKP